MVNTFRDPGLNLFASSTLGKIDNVTLGDGTTAIRQVITGKSPTGEDITMQITFARTSPRFMLSSFLAPMLPCVQKRA